MLEKTNAIILHQIKYTDSGIIVQVYTRESGRLSVMVKGLRNRKSGKHNVFFQPLSILELIMYSGKSGNIHTLREFSSVYSPAGIYGSIVKSTMALFLGEVLTTVLREESQNCDLFNYIRNSIIYLDTRKEGFANFHIAFLIGLCSYLGFEPGKKIGADNVIFDMENGAFVSIPPSHGNYADTETSGILAEFFRASWNDMNMIMLTGAKRNEILMTMMKYYSVHLPVLKKINSLEILKEVFG